MGYKVAVVGATGNVGREMLSILAERSFPADEVVALAARIPPDLKLRRLTRKYVFKRSMQGVVPRDVIWRRKAGFGAPLRAWLDDDLRPLVDDLLSPERVRARGLFEPTEVQRLIAANRAGTEDNALRIWTLLTFEMWLRGLR